MFFFFKHMSTASSFIASNALLRQSADWLGTILNSGHFLRLFSNNIAPTPATPLTGFNEAAFSGYAAVNLLGLFSSSVLVMVGELQIPPVIALFIQNGALIDTVYGWYITSGTNVKLSGRLVTPVTFNVNTSFQIQLNVQEWALSIVP